MFRASRLLSRKERYNGLDSCDWLLSTFDKILKQFC